jgi:phosphate-selective porin OprO/OprP
MLKLGNQKVAQTLSGQTSSISIPFMERSLPVLAFTLQHRLGVGYELHRQQWGGTASVFSHDINEQLGSEGYAARLYFHPTKSARRVAHLGVSGLSFKNDEDGRLRARPESHRTDTRLVDTGLWEDADHTSAFGLEFAGLVGPITVRSEFYRLGWTRDEGADPTFSGWYIDGSWFMTGEISNYRQGKFIRPDVRNPRGAWELAARFSSIDLNDEDVRGGTEDNFTLGVNWYSQVHWRFMGNLIKVNADGPEGRENPWIVQFRAQYFF